MTTDFFAPQFYKNILDFLFALWYGCFERRYIVFSPISEGLFFTYILVRIIVLYQFLYGVLVVHAIGILISGWLEYSGLGYIIVEFGLA